MCGLSGYLNLSRSSFNPQQEQLEAMQRVLAHRGPNGSSLTMHNDHGLGLAFCRLSIVDLSDAGMQPMFDAQRSVVICFNGEIYNHAILRKELESLGHRYVTNTDTETLIYAYKQWGIAFLDRLEGMFAIVLYDFTKRELYLVRDRMGVKPLYFSVADGVLSFASEIKALWQLPWMQKNINSTALHHYLTFMVSPAPMTMFAGVYKLPASFYAKVDAQKKLTFHEWYTPLRQLDLGPAHLSSEQEVVGNVRTLLRKAVAKRMMADVPLGVFLSGGVDSSLIVALMAELTDKVNTFTISWADEPAYDELRWARTVAKRFNTQHHEIVISEKEAFEFFNTMIYQQDEPLADCVNIPLYFVSKLLKDHGVTVVQIGEGADELFCGYATYGRYLHLYNRYWKSSQRYIPAFAKKGIYHALAPLLGSRPNKVDYLKNWAEHKHLFWSGATAFSETWKARLVRSHAAWHDPIIESMYPGFNQGADSYAVVEYHLRMLHERDPDADFLKAMIYLELKHRLPELLLMRADKMTMATGVEGRVPFLDHALVEYALQIPTELKFRNGVTKYILKKAAEGILPHDLIYRPKMGFAAPTERWFKQGAYFKPYFLDLLQSKKGFWQEYVDIAAVHKLYQSHQHKNNHHAVQLWVLQNLMATDFV